MPKEVAVKLVRRVAVLVEPVGLGLFFFITHDWIGIIKCQKLLHRKYKPD
jgi:hypothetical protein